MSGQRQELLRAVQQSQETLPVAAAQVACLQECMKAIRLSLT